MSNEDTIERGDAPVAGAANPIWKYLFLGALGLGGTAALGWIGWSSISSDEPEAPPTQERPRLNFGGPDWEVPKFAPPKPVVEQPPPPPPAIAPPVVEIPAPPVIPQLPPPEPREGYRPEIPEAPPPVVERAARPSAKPEKTPEQLARERRLEAPLSGTGGGGTAGGSADAGGEAGSRRGGIDLSTTRAASARARRLDDMTLLIPKGTYIPCTLETAIQSDQAGMVSCILPRDVYGADGTVVLLDRGSSVLGEYRTATLEAGKRRMFVVWDRVRTPTGVVVDIASPGTGPLGRAGMGGEIDNHYWERVGIPVLMSAVSFGAESYAQDALTPDQGQFIQQTTDNTLSGVLGELAKIKPTLHAHQGSIVNILVARDLDLSEVYALRVAHVR